MGCNKRSLFLVMLYIVVAPCSSGRNELTPHSSRLNEDDAEAAPSPLNPYHPDIFGLGAYDVFIFDGNIPNLCLQCRSSKGYNLGYHCLYPGDSGLSWTARRKLFKRPSFFCEFWLRTNTSAIYDVFDSKVAEYCRDIEHGGRYRCYWLIRTDGFYLSDHYLGFPNNGWVKMYDWSVNH